ncbi:MAG: DUF2079 domain-containing protein, partial [Candidatus Bathyarchaeia archaeon]
MTHLKEVHVVVQMLRRIDARLLVWAMIGLYTTFFSYFTVLRHYTFQTHAYDLGIFMQSFWTTINEGQLFYTTLWEGSRFARHFSPILFFLLPLYAIFPRAETLLIFQSFFLALGAVPIYWIARNEFDSEKAGVVSALLYLCYPALHGMNRFDFHELSLAPVFILFAFHYFKEQKYWNSMVFIVFALLCRGDVSLAIVPIGVYWFWERRGQWSRKDVETIFSVSIISIGIVWFFLTMFVIVPYFNQPYSYFYMGQYKIEYLFLDLDRKLLYIIKLFAPLLYIPLFDGLILMALPALGQGLLSTNASRYSINNHHPALLVPFIFLSAIYSIKRVSTLVDNSIKHVFQEKLLAPLLVISLLLCFFTSPIPQMGMPVITPHHRALKEVIKLIPDDASVYTQNDLFPHLAHRSNVYYVAGDKAIFTGWVTPSPIKTVVPWKRPVQFDFILMDDASDGWSMLRRTDEKSLQMILEQYKLYAVVDKIYLFKRNCNGSLWRPFFDIFEHGLVARFYNNKNLDGTPVLEDRVPNVYFDWDKDSPVRGLIPENRFSVEFDGYLYAPETGYYDFRLRHDNGARLYLDEQLIVDSWGETPTAEEFSLYLEEGFHKIHIDYWENVSNASI